MSWSLDRRNMSQQCNVQATHIFQHDLSSKWTQVRHQGCCQVHLQVQKHSAEVAWLPEDQNALMFYILQRGWYVDLGLDAVLQVRSWKYNKDIIEHWVDTSESGSVVDTFTEKLTLQEDTTDDAVVEPVDDIGIPSERLRSNAEVEEIGDEDKFVARSTKHVWKHSRLTHHEFVMRL